MEVAGMCDICGKLLVKFACSLCGAKVCPACYDYNGKACKNCAGGKKADAPPSAGSVLEEVDDEDGIGELFKS